MTQRVDRLREMLHELLLCDPQFSVFGASSHYYQLNPPLSESVVAGFEGKYGVTLPADYRDFLLEMGNGGAGPYYGLLSLDQVVADIDKQTTPKFLASSFPHSASFNPYKPGVPDEELFDCRFITGSIPVAHQGCGYFDRLVVSGLQRGTIWTDGRVSDQGIVPLHVDFYSWYQNWLSDSLAEVGT